MCESCVDGGSFTPRTTAVLLCSMLWFRSIRQKLWCPTDTTARAVSTPLQYSLHLTTPGSHTGNFLAEELQPILPPEGGEGMSPTPSSVYKIKDTHIHVQCNLFTSFSLTLLSSCPLQTAIPSTPFLGAAGSQSYWRTLEYSENSYEGYKQWFLLHPPTFSTFSLTGDQSREQWGWIYV